MSGHDTETKDLARTSRSAGAGHGPMGGAVHEKAINFGPSLKRLLATMRPERAWLALVVLAGVVGVGLNVVGPRLLGRATDILFAGVIGSRLPAGMTKEQVVQMLRERGDTTFATMVERLDITPGQSIDFTALGYQLLLVLAIYLASALILWSQGWVLNTVVQRTIRDLRKQVSTKLDRLPLSYFDHQPRGELLSRVTNDIDNVSQSLQQTLSQLLTALLTVLGVTVMMFWVSPPLALVSLIAIPVSVVAVAIIGKRSQALFADTWKATGEVTAKVEEAYTGHALVKVFGRQQEVEESFAEGNDRLFRASRGAQFLTGIMMPVMFFIGNLNYVVIAVMGGLRVANGQMNVGDIQAFIQYSRMFTQPLTQVASMANLLQSGVASAERVFEILDAEEQSPDATGSLPPTRGHVRFEDVSFSYTDEPLIEHLDLDVAPGSTLAIVGPTGAGKTTLVNLLMRFYEVDEGRITLDGTDIATVPRADLRRRTGMVLQDTWLFGGTIRDNIAYGRIGATDDEILAAAEASYVDRFVHSLPDGYDTIIDEEGSNVSVGERQLITIARAFLADPALLILDEATSSVDTRTEVLVQHAMNHLRAGRTAFVIAHRLSTIRDADVIVVMESGRIVERGSHDELVAAGGTYRRLHDSQFAGMGE